MGLVALMEGVEVEVKERRGEKTARGASQAGRLHSHASTTATTRMAMAQARRHSPIRHAPIAAPDARPNHALVMHAESKSFVSAVAARLPQNERHMSCHVHAMHTIVHFLLY